MIASDGWTRRKATASPAALELVRGVAIHEAGHVVMMRLRAAGVARVSLSVQILEGLEVDTLGLALPRDPTWVCARVWAAGAAAQLEAGIQPHLHEEERLGILERLPRSRLRSVEDAICSARFELRTEGWDAVLAVAAALENVGHLDGEAAERLVDANLPEWRRGWARLA